ncbi:MAG: rubredoxin [Novosphingobium sp.]
MTKSSKCLNCGYIQDEAPGWLDDGMQAGARWRDVSDDWIFPECGSDAAVPLVYCRASAACSRWKNSAWPMVAATVSGLNGLVMR